nr:PREDICTED: glutamyl-tRNA(Gln) amidotransferase subunit B, mitochondrial [Bemisia tabaci]
MIVFKRINVHPGSLVRRSAISGFEEGSSCLKCFMNSCRWKSTNQRQLKSKWQSVVGLEVHAQINSKSKLFSDAEIDFMARPNTRVSLFDAAIPGTLPVLNKRCVEAGVRAALALSSTINPVSLFDRKHYFYSDLPAGYQITQQRLPLAQGGHLEFEVFTQGIHDKPYMKSCQLTQLQLEQDSGRSLHEEEKSRTLIDLNRAGIPLIELVFAPDLNDGEEAVAMVRELCRILEVLDVCSGKMEEGALRVDANVSVRQIGSSELGVRSEVKNIGGIRSVGNAIHFEVKRHISILESGGTIVNETRFWDPQSNKTYPMRDKEVDQDYRFMPEPNLPPLRVDLSGNLSDPDIVNVPNIEAQLPELPRETRLRLKEHFKLPGPVVTALMSDSKLLRYFLDITSEDSNRNPKTVANVGTIELNYVLNKANIKTEYCNLESTTLGEIVDLLQSGTINLPTVKKLLFELIVNNSSKTPTQLVEDNQWQQITEPEKIAEICRKEIAGSEDLVASYKVPKKKDASFNKMMKNIAESSGGRVNMKLAVTIMRELLDGNK